MRRVEDIKYGQRVMDAVSQPYFFAELLKVTSLESKVLQKTLAALAKYGYVVKDPKGRWTVCWPEDEVTCSCEREYEDTLK